MLDEIAVIPKVKKKSINHYQYNQLAVYLHYQMREGII